MPLATRASTLEATDPNSPSYRRRKRAVARAKRGKKETPKPPSRRAVLKLISEYDYELCRMLGHQWTPPNGKRPIEIVNTAGKRGLVAYPVYCGQCNTTRMDYINPRTGHLEARKYNLPEGYLLKGLGDSRPSKDDWRKETLARVLK